MTKRKKKIRQILLFCLIASLTNAANFAIANDMVVNSTQQTQQPIGLSGTVTDTGGEPLVGVSISIKSRSMGTVTDDDGRFHIQANPGDVLQLSYVGYATKTITVGNDKVLNIVLNEDQKSLNEVVVVGYGTQKKVNLTGAVSTINSESFEDRPITNLASALAGLSSGLYISQNAGSRPGYDGSRIRIRGTGTLNNSDPLIVIDGQVAGGINDVNPADVENISILKDASSSAIYGSRAANGVILITTRRGKSGTAKLTYQGNISTQKPANKYNIVSNYADYMELINESYRNAGIANNYSQEKIEEWRNAGNSDPIKYPNTDWQDEFYRTGWMQNHTLSATGGTDQIRYFMSGNFLNNPGIVRHAEFERYSTRTNIEADLKSWLTVGANLFGYTSTANTNTLAIATDGDAVFGGAMGTTPGMVLQHPDGRFGAPNNPEDPAGSGNNNPFRRMNFYKHEIPIRTYNFRPRFYGIVKPVKGLSLEGSYAYNYWYQVQPRHLQDADLWNFYTNTIARPGTVRTYISVRTERSYQHEMNAIARYTFDIGKLDVGIIAGASQEKYLWEYENVRKYDFLDPSLIVFDAAPNDPTVAGNLTEWAMRSFFGRVNLNWDEKYMFEANFRNDGSSRFSPGKNRWGFFPSFSAGWRISEEGFMKDIDWISMLKLRLSYGSLGNNAVSNYAYQSLYAAANYVLNSSIAGGVAQTMLSDPNITWETTKMTNYGIDFGLLNNRLTGSFEIFNKNTEGILIALPAPLVHGTSSVPNQNAATVNNKGFELELGWRDKIGKVGYHAGGSFGLVKNKVTKFRGDVASISGTNMILEGQPINIQYVLEVDRIIQTDEDMALVQAMVDKNPAAFSVYQRPEKGDFLYKDNNGDGVLSPDDRIRIGWGQDPQISYGFSFGANWENFDCSAIFQGVARWKAFYSDAYYRFTVAAGNAINKTIADGRWYDGRTDAKYPRLLANSNTKNNQASDAFIFDKSYLRVKNIQFGYTVPKNIANKVFMDNIRLYGSIENAFTFTKNYPGLDPEMTYGAAASYPTLVNYSFGINLNF